MNWAWGEEFPILVVKHRAAWSSFKTGFEHEAGLEDLKVMLWFSKPSNSQQTFASITAKSLRRVWRKMRMLLKFLGQCLPNLWGVKRKGRCISGDCYSFAKILGRYVTILIWLEEGQEMEDLWVFSDKKMKYLICSCRWHYLEIRAEQERWEHKQTPTESPWKVGICYEMKCYKESLMEELQSRCRGLDFERTWSQRLKTADYMRRK